MDGGGGGGGGGGDTLSHTQYHIPVHTVLVCVCVQCMCVLCMYVWGGRGVEIVHVNGTLK